MATVYSANLTNIRAIPQVHLTGKAGVVNKVIDQIALAATAVDNADDLILLGHVPSNAKITSIKISNDDLDSNGTPALACNIGLYYSGVGNYVNGVLQSAGSVVDADVFAAASTILRAAAVKTEVRFLADDIVDIQKEAWEAGGLSADCGGLFFVGLDISTAAATAAAGDIVIEIEYII